MGVILDVEEQVWKTRKSGLDTIYDSFLWNASGVLKDLKDIDKKLEELYKKINNHSDMTYISYANYQGDISDLESWNEKYAKYANGGIFQSQQ